VDIYIKYYPKNYESYPNDFQKNPWYWLYNGGSGYCINNNTYINYIDPTSTNIQVILPPSRFVYNSTVIYTDPSVNYTSNYGGFIFRENFGLLNDFYAYRGITDFFKENWSLGTNWYPDIVTTFKNNCVTFIKNNNPKNWGSINLDIWLKQFPTGVTGQKESHIFLYYEGNNPAYDEKVVI